MRTACIVIIALTLFSVTANAQQVTPSDAKRAERVATLIDWVKREGRDSQLDGKAAHALGLTPGFEPIPARRKAFQDDGIGHTNFVYAVNLLQVDGRGVRVLFRTTTRVSTLWLIGQSGTIESVAEYTREAGIQNPKDHRLKLLEETIAYLETEMRKAQH